MRCIVCDHETQSFYHPQTNVLFHECLHCKAIFKDKMHWPTPDDEMNRYKEHNNSINESGYVKFLNGFIEYGVTPYLKEGSILDFGSGPEAVLASLLKDRGFDVLYYDPFFEPHLPEEIVFDMITATEVFEHIQDPVKQLKWIDHHLRKEGYFSMMTLLYPEDRNLFYNWFYLRDITHIIFYHSKTYEYMAQLLNWKVIKDDGYRIAVFQK